MNVLLVAPQSGFTDQLLEAMRAKNTNVVYFNDRQNFLVPKLFSKNSFLWRMCRLIPILRHMGNKLLAENLLNVVDLQKPDLVFFNKSLAIGVATIEAIRSRGVLTANYFPENTFIAPYDRWLKETAGSYDFLFSFDSAIVQYMADIPHHVVSFIPFGIDPKTYTVASLSEHDRKKYFAPVVFIGACYPERVRFLSAIRDLGLVIYGWRGWEHSSLSKYYRGPLTLSESAKVYASSSICINLNTEPITHGVNLRTFEIPAAGGFQISDYRKDLDNLFVIGKEIVTCTTPEELRQRVIYYLSHDAERRMIALAGQDRVLRDHTIIGRIATMFDIIRHTAL